MTRAKARLLPVLPLIGALLATAACSTANTYPSLAQREVERVGGSAAPAGGEAGPPAPVQPPASADLVTRLDGLVAMAREAERQFQSNRPAAERAVASAGERASDSWSAASVALARLESSRSSAMTALADLDTLYADARDKAPLGESPSTAAIGAARAQVSGWVDGQDRVIAALDARLKG